MVIKIIRYQILITQYSFHTVAFRSKGTCYDLLQHRVTDHILLFSATQKGGGEGYLLFYSTLHRRT
jgi:hypothetical protein